MFNFILNPVSLVSLPADTLATPPVIARGGPPQPGADAEALEHRAEFVAAGALI